MIQIKPEYKNCLCGAQLDLVAFALFLIGDKIFIRCQCGHRIEVTLHDDKEEKEAE